MGACLSGPRGGPSGTTANPGGHGKARSMHLLAQAIAQDDFVARDTLVSSSSSGMDAKVQLVGSASGTPLGGDSDGSHAGGTGRVSSSSGNTLSAYGSSLLNSGSCGSALYAKGGALPHSGSCSGGLATFNGDLGSSASSSGRITFDACSASACGTSVVLPLVTAHPWLLEAALKLPCSSPGASTNGAGAHPHVITAGSAAGPRSAMGGSGSGAAALISTSSSSAAAAAAAAAAAHSGSNRGAGARAGRHSQPGSLHHSGHRPSGLPSGTSGGGAGAARDKGEATLTAYHMAVAMGSHHALYRLLSLCNGRSSDELCARARRALNAPRPIDGATPLMSACEKGDVLAIRLLLDAGADPWARQEPYRRTCLHYAAANGYAAAIHVVLEHAHAILNAKAAVTVYPASRSPSIRAGRPLVDLASCGGLTPLMAAAATGHAAAVEELLSMGADPFLCCWDHNTDPLCCAPHGSTALHLAAASGSLPTAAAILRACDAMPLSKRDCGSSACVTHPDIRCTLNGMGQTPLQVAEAAMRTRHAKAHSTSPPSSSSALTAAGGAAAATAAAAPGRGSAAAAAAAGGANGGASALVKTGSVTFPAPSGPVTVTMSASAPHAAAAASDADVQVQVAAALTAWTDALTPRGGGGGGGGGAGAAVSPPPATNAHVPPGSTAAGMTAAALRTARLKALTQPQPAVALPSPHLGAQPPHHPHNSNQFRQGWGAAGVSGGPPAPGPFARVAITAPHTPSTASTPPYSGGGGGGGGLGLGLSAAELQQLLLSSGSSGGTMALGPGWKPPHSVPPTSVKRASVRSRRGAVPSVPTVFERRSQEGTEEELFEEAAARSGEANACVRPGATAGAHHHHHHHHSAPQRAASPFSGALPKLPPSPAASSSPTSPRDCCLGPQPSTEDSGCLTHSTSQALSHTLTAELSLGTSSAPTPAAELSPAVGLTPVMGLTPAASIEHMQSGLSVHSMHSGVSVHSGASNGSAWLPLPPGEAEDEGEPSFLSLEGRGKAGEQGAHHSLLFKRAGGAGEQEGRQPMLPCESAIGAGEQGAHHSLLPCKRAGGAGEQGPHQSVLPCERDGAEGVHGGAEEAGETGLSGSMNSSDATVADGSTSTSTSGSGSGSDCSSPRRMCGAAAVQRGGSAGAGRGGARAECIA